jgi:hypothetical protein
MNAASTRANGSRDHLRFSAVRNPSRRQPRYPQLNAILDENWRELMMGSGKARRLPRAPRVMVGYSRGLIDPHR